VWLSESLGPQKLAIPNLLGQDQRVASIEVRRAEMQIGVVATMPWASAQPGTVIAQSPEPDASGVATPVMDLLVAVPDTNAPPPDALVMPDLQGQLFTAAALSLTRMGLHLAPLQQRPAPMAPVSPPGSPQSSTPGPATPTPPAGTIVAQSPPAGSRVDPSIPIQLTVAQ
jgi:beta-lactam-binding protein with PASTA domain